MKNFSRVLRLAFQYRVTLVLSLLCALGVAVLWGGNIGSVYPFVEVAFQGESLQQWVDGEIEKGQRTIAQKSDEAERIRRELETAPAEAQRDLGAGLGLAESRIAAEEKAVARYQWLKPYIDNYLPHDPFQTLALITGLLLLGTVVKDLFLIGNTILVARLAELSTFELRKLFYRRTLRVDLARFGEEGAADLMSRFTHDMQQVTTGVATLLGRLVREPLKMAACLIGAGLICWRLLILSLLAAPIAMLLIRWLAKILKRANLRAMEEMAQIYTTLDETLRGIKIVKAFTNEPQQRKRFHIQAKKYYKKSMRIARYDSLVRPISEVMGIVAICLALLAGAYLVLSNETHLMGIRMSPRPLSLGSLLLFYGLLAGVADPVRKFSDVFTRLQCAAAASDRIFARLDCEPKILDPPQPVALTGRRHELEFDGVDFAYTPGRLVLRDVNLRLERGQTVAVVGPNGCGKSTLTNLILRFYDPTAGTVRIDGVPLTDVRLRDLRKRIGLVTQETLLFDETILENIRFGSPRATRQQVIEAAKRAHAHDFIQRELPDGYETIAGSMGNRLSGGQRQRIALARAILRDPAIIILDEATSQVDLESERAIQHVLEEFIRDRTALIITHRLSILSLASKIVVMQSGRILDTGSHEELLRRCGLYSRLYQIQFEEPEAEPPIAA
ncbi:MAG TPA: ABC transporter ATP-binding protein [Thermoguttaceae bacterium]|nr:ABC transporter ATP-binding protein [Thermoguttaceae bacterium]